MTPGLGEFMVTKTDSWIAWVIRKLTKSPVNHAAIYIGKGFIVEAQPGGARITQAKVYPSAIWSTHVMDVHTRLAIINKAIDLVGTPYSFLDIAALAVEKVFGHHAPNFVLNRVNRCDRLICSQLVTVVYKDAGIDLFPDRFASDITPGDLYDLIVKEK